MWNVSPSGVQAIEVVLKDVVVAVHVAFPSAQATSVTVQVLTDSNYNPKPVRRRQKGKRQGRRIIRQRNKS